MLIHNFEDNLILFLILLVQCLHSDGGESEHGSKPALRLLMRHLRVLRLVVLRLLVILAGVLLLDLAVHELLRGIHLAAVSVSRRAALLFH